MSLENGDGGVFDKMIVSENRVYLNLVAEGLLQFLISHKLNSIGL